MNWKKRGKKWRKKGKKSKEIDKVETVDSEEVNIERGKKGKRG
jgi:hypothetical protein